MKRSPQSHPEIRTPHTALVQAIRHPSTGSRQGGPVFWLMRQAGRYLPEYRRLRETQPDFVHFCLTPELTVEAALQPIRRYNMDAAILFSDILMIPHALGCGVRFIEGTGPVLNPVDDDGMAGWDDVDWKNILRPVFESVRLLRAALAPEKSLIGFAGAPWTVACYMIEGKASRGFDQAKIWMLQKPHSFRRLIDRLTDLTIDYLLEQIAAGADLVQLFDSWAGVLPDGWIKMASIDPMARIVRTIKQHHPDFPVLVFAPGVGPHLAHYAAILGADILSIDRTMPLSWAAEQIQRTDTAQPVGLQGNLDPSLLVVGGDVLDQAVDHCLDQMRDRPVSYIFNLGHGILPQTPPDHVARMADRLRRG